MSLFKRSVLLLLSALMILLSAVSVSAAPLKSAGSYANTAAAARAIGTSPILQYTFRSGSNSFEYEGIAESPANLWDGNTATKFCTNEFPAYSVASTEKPVSVNGVILGTANDHDNFPGRLPKNWTISGSADGRVWTLIASGTDTFFEEVNYTYYAAAVPRTAAYSYFKFETTGTESGTFQLSEVVLCSADAGLVSSRDRYADSESAARAIGRIPLTGLTYASGSDVYFSWGDTPESPNNLWDKNTATKFCTDSFPAYSAVSVNGSASVNGIILCTANDHTSYPGRLPEVWKLSGSNDGVTWETVVYGTDAFFEEVDFTYFAAAFEPSKPYAFFRFEVDSTASGTFQLSEIVLCGKRVVQPGTVIGQVLSTDIRAYINGAEIPAYNIDGKLAILVSDLNNYGFRTSFSNSLRMTAVTRDRSASKFQSVPSKASGLPIGAPVMSVYSTDITVELDGIEVPAFNVDNRMAIYFSELKPYGAYTYDNSRRASLLVLK